MNALKQKMSAAGSAVSDKSLEATDKILKSIQEVRPLMRSCGYDVAEVSTVLSLPPAVGTTMVPLDPTPPEYDEKNLKEVDESKLDKVCYCVLCFFSPSLVPICGPHTLSPLIVSVFCLFSFSNPFLSLLSFNRLILSPSFVSLTPS